MPLFLTPLRLVFCGTFLTTLAQFHIAGLSDFPFEKSSYEPAT